MKNVVLPLIYFGNIAYFRYLFNASNIWLCDTEPYLKQTYRNRTRILGANGPLELSVPIISTKGKTIPIDQIEISYDENWPLNHWRSIESAYKASPFFDEYQEDIKLLVFSKPEKLVDLNKIITDSILNLLDSKLSYRLTSDSALPENIADYRTYFKPSKSPDFKNFKPYLQVFTYKFDFEPNLSILDLLFNEGPYSRAILE